MTTSSPSETKSDVEDIFSDTVSETPLPLIPTPQRLPAQLDYVEPTSTASYTPVTNSRRGLFIAIGIATLLLLGISSLGLVIWLRSGSAPNPPDTANGGVDENPVLVTNTDSVTPPINQPVDTTPQFIDTDHDGLSDEEEVIANTNPKKQDTDDDGLSDREELRVYDTDPRDPDTDKDGYNDGAEVANFYHPNSPDPKQRLFDLPN